MTTADTTDPNLTAAPATEPDAAPAIASPEAADPPPGAAPDAPQGQPKAEEPPKSALEAVLRAEAARRKEEEAKAAPAPAKPAAADAPAESEGERRDAHQEDEGRIPDEVFNKLPAEVKRRFGFLTRKSNEQRDRLRSLEPVVARDAGLQRFLEEHQVPASEFQWLMQFAALVKRDPAKAYEHMQPLVTSLRQHVGEVLPEDLAAEVDAGSISRERAQELARARNAKAVSDAHAEREANARVEQETRVQHGQHVASVAAAVTGWENQWKGSDPDYARKQPFVWPEMQMLISDAMRENGGQALGAAAVVELAKRARKNVETRLSGFTPPPRPKTTVTGGLAAMTVKEPSNAMEAARIGLARARQAQAA